MTKRLVLSARLDSSAADQLRSELIAAHGKDLVLDGAQVELLGGLCTELLMSAKHLWAHQKNTLTLENASIILTDNLKRMGLSPDDIATGDSA